MSDLKVDCKGCGCPIEVGTEQKCLDCRRAFGGTFPATLLDEPETDDE